MCPPYAPSVDDFRKTLSEYSYVLVLKFKSQAEATSEIAPLLSMNENDSSLTENERENMGILDVLEQ